MAVTLVLIHDANGELHDSEGHLRNASGQKIDDQGVVIHDLEVDVVEAAAADNGLAARPRTLADYNRPDQYYTNMSAIRPPTFLRNNFKLKPAYFTLVGQQLYHGLPHEHPMDHRKHFEDLVYAIKANGVLDDHFLCKLFKYSLVDDDSYWLKQLPPGSLTSWKAIKYSFMRNFFDDARSEDLRNIISMFT